MMGFSLGTFALTVKLDMLTVIPVVGESSMVGEWIEQVTSCGLVLYWRMTKCPDGFRSVFRPKNQVMKRAFLQRSRPRIIAGIIHLPTLLSEIPLVLPPSSDLVPDHM